MSVAVKRYVRNPLYVDVVVVTEENMTDVAEWCDGKIRTTKDDNTGEPVKYVKVDVLRPQTDRQGMAFVNDYVLKTEQGFKVYPPRAFSKSFVPAPVTE